MRQIAVLFLLVLFAAVPLRADLVNRYSFTTGDVGAVDSVGDKHGTLEDSAFIENNQLVLDGGGWVELPADVLEDYTSGSIEVWFTPGTLANWMRVFDFGDTGVDGMGGDTWFYTPLNEATGSSRLVIGTEGVPSYSTGEIILDGPVLESNVMYHVVAVFDEDGGTEGAPALRFYHNGVLIGENTDTSPHQLANVARVHAYLGRALYPDPLLNGAISEFRIYNAPLMPLDILLNSQWGPDQAQPNVFESITPVNGDDKVLPEPTLEWTVKPGYTPTEFQVYLGTDPNITDPNFAGIGAFLLTTTDQTSVNVTDHHDPLDFVTLYYWRVDATIGGDTFAGPGLSFTTVDEAPVITTQPSAVLLDAVGDDAVFELVAYSYHSENYYWFKALDPENPDPDVDTQVSAIQHSFFPVFTLTDVQLEDEGYYYCRVQSFGTLMTLSDVFTVGIKRQLAHWTLDGLVGGQYADEEDNYPADPNGTPVFIDGAYPDVTGNAVVIDQVNGFATAGTWNPSEFSSQFTISLWAKWYGQTDPETWQGLISKEQSYGAGNMMWQLEVNQGSPYNVAWKNGMEQGNLTTPTLPIDAWEHIVVTWNGTVATIYRNGIQAASGDWQPGTMTDAPINIGISAFSPTTNLMFNGALDDIRIYNYAFDSMDIALDYTGISSESVCYDRPLLDYDGDCVVNLGDLAMFAQNWLDCAVVPDCLP